MPFSRPPNSKTQYTSLIQFAIDIVISRYSVLRKNDYSQKYPTTV